MTLLDEHHNGIQQYLPDTLPSKLSPILPKRRPMVSNDKQSSQRIESHSALSSRLTTKKRRPFHLAKLQISNTESSHKKLTESRKVTVAHGQTKSNLYCISNDMRVLSTRDKLSELIKMVAQMTSEASNNRECKLQLPRDIPSSFFSSANINISNWTLMVSDSTLHRIAAHYKRLANLIKIRNESAMNHLPLHETDITEQDDNFPKALIMNGAETISDAGLESVVKFTPTLEKLQIGDAVRITDTGIRAVALHCPKLTQLYINNCKSVQGISFGALAVHCPKIQDLSVAGCHQLGEWALLRCIYAFSDLQILNLSFCRQVSDQLLHTLSSQCRRLHSINLKECVLISDSGIEAVARHCLQLQTINISRTCNSSRITDTSCAVLGENCPHLKELCIVGCDNITDVGIQCLATKGCVLQHIDATDVLRLTDAALRSIGDACHSLLSLQISGSKAISNVGLRYVAMGCHHLQTLHLNGLHLISDGAKRDFGFEGLQVVAQSCPGLQNIDMSKCFQLVDRSLVSLSKHCQALQKVSLKGCYNVTAEALNILIESCRDLKSLNLSGVVLCDDSVLSSIGGHEALCILILSSCERITDQGLQYLAKRVNQYTVLDFSHCIHISDFGLNCIIDAFNRPAIAHLYLSGCNLITIDSIGRIALVCPKLLTLNIQGCNISPQIFRSFRLAWRFGTIRSPKLGRGNESSSGIGLSPLYRAKEKRTLEETLMVWTAATKLQNCYRCSCARKSLRKKQHLAQQTASAVVIQAHWRGRSGRYIAKTAKLVFCHQNIQASKIQFCFRNFQKRCHKTRDCDLIWQQKVEEYAVRVQRHFRQKNTTKIENAVRIAQQKQFEKENKASIKLQKRFRGKLARKLFNKLIIDQQKTNQLRFVMAIRLQKCYRQYIARKKIGKMVLAWRSRKNLALVWAVQIQRAFRLNKVLKGLDQLKQLRIRRIEAALHIQKVYRARNCRQSVGFMKAIKYRDLCNKAAACIQRQWVLRKQNIWAIASREAKDRLRRKREAAAVLLQCTFRRYRIFTKAREVLKSLRALQELEQHSKAWVVTVLQSHWRRQLSKIVAMNVRLAKRSRWKQLIDYGGYYGRGYGAPFYYNQLSNEVRWRKPQELLSLEKQPTCSHCETAETAVVECATCCEYFCTRCQVLIHKGGKRKLHVTRPLFDYYMRRKDTGDDDFPSIWPSAQQQDYERGYDFVSGCPTEGYEEVVEIIKNSMPVSFGMEDDGVGNSSLVSCPNHTNFTGSPDNELFHNSSSSQNLEFNEPDVDKEGNSLWREFYDYSQQQYCYYHIISKRVITRLDCYEQNEATTEP